MSFVDDLKKTKTAAIEAKKNEKSRIDRWIESIVNIVKIHTQKIAEKGGPHHAEGFAGSDASEGLYGLYKDSSYPANNLAFDLNHGYLTVDDLGVICEKTTGELRALGFKKVSVEIRKENLTEIEQHPANIERYGYSEVYGGFLKLKKAPKKYFYYVSVSW